MIEKSEETDYHDFRTIALIMGATFLGLALLRIYSYLLFHTIAELYSIIIASVYFVIAWQTRHLNENKPVATLGMAYFFVAFLDLFHTLAYAGMGIFTGYEFPANQVWVIARFMEAISLLIFSQITLNSRRQTFVFFCAYSLATLGGLASIFVFRFFPACFIAGQGQTGFKIAAELVIIGILGLASWRLMRWKAEYHWRVYLKLQLSIGLTILSELSFMLYLSNFDWINVFGHFLKIASFYLVYRSIVVTGLRTPQELLYAKLRTSEEGQRKANEAKDTFISILTHDLKGPLSGIMNMADELPNFRGEASEADMAAALAELRRSARSSLDLVERVLSWARSQSGALSPQLRGVKLLAICEAECALLEKSAGGKDIRLRMSVPADALIAADRDMLATILRNLIHNGIKFTERGGSLVVSAEKAGAAWTVSVTDSGIGMSHEEMSRIFSLEKRKRSIGTEGERGVGFGLILCKEFAERMGGRLEVESKKGEGSTFRLTLPVYSSS